MSQKKSTHTKNCQNESILDMVLWFMKNYLPQKKKRSSHVEPILDKFESFTIHKFKKLASYRSKSLRGDLNNTTLTFTIGNWALPYLKLLKKMKLLR